jgi:hypothetical protein
MDKEYAALVVSSTRDLVLHLSGINVMKGKWVFKHKFHADGSLEHYKVHKVCWGFT